MKTTLVPTRQTCQALQEAGFDIDTNLYWRGDTIVLMRGVHEKRLKERENLVKAYTFSHLFNALPEDIEPHSHEVLQIAKGNGMCEVHYGIDESLFVEDGPAEAISQLALWLAENNHINPENDHEQE